MRKRRELAGSRTAVLRLLCTGARTVRQLSAELGISGTAVRKSLDRLERDGLVRHEPVAQGVGKPAHVYTITPEGEQLSSRVYQPLLSRVLEVLRERLPAAEVESVVRESTARLAGTLPAAPVDVRGRIAAATAALNQLGGIATAKQEDGMLVIECSCCALGSLVLEHPVACRGMEALLAQYLSTPVRERCERAERPHCRFEIAAPVA